MGENSTVWCDWEYYKVESELTKLKALCFWFRWDLNDVLAYLEEQEVTIAEALQEFKTGVSFEKACKIAKNKRIADTKSNPSFPLDGKQI